MELLALIEGPTGRLILYTFLFLSVVGIGTGIFLAWRNSIKAADLSQYNQTQLQQIVKDQETTLQIMKDLNDLQIASGTDAQSQRDKIDAQLNTILQGLNSSDNLKTDRPASDIVKEAVKQLQGLTP